jgi:hypothetical protein
MKLNIALSAVANVLGAINAANTAVSLALTEAQVTFAAPAVTAGTAGRNTSITLTGVNGQGVEGSRTFSYTRQSLAAGAVASTAPASVTTAPGDTEAASLTKVATALGLLAGEFTSSAFTAPADMTTPGTITLTANAASLVYTGARTVALNFPDSDVDFATLAPTTDLDGFDAEA